MSQKPVKVSESDAVANVRDATEPVLVSACLLGVHCRYDASTNPSPDLVAKLGAARIIPVCPEQLGGLGTPRPPAHFEAGDGDAVLNGTARVVTDTGADVTAQFLRGAHESLRLAQLVGAKRAILKERSPSCGCCQVNRDGALQPGRGVTVALLRREGIVVESLDPPKER